MTTDSKNHLVAPAVSTDDYPVIQEDAHRRLSEDKQEALDLASEEERENRFSSKKTRTQTHHCHWQKVQLQNV